MLIFKCILYYNDVYFFDILTSKSYLILRYFIYFNLEISFTPQRRVFLTSKSGPRMVYFVHFDLEMCFAPQRRVFFRHLNF
jgi:hypothetical protein